MFVQAYLQQRDTDPLPILTRQTPTALLIECEYVDQFLRSIFPLGFSRDDAIVSPADLQMASKVRAVLIEGEGLYVDVMDEYGAILFSNGVHPSREAEGLLRSKLLWQAIEN